ncbi:hypothetical protein AB0I93_13255 [Streptomyces sp. NPDC049967]|uniref:hypothetical protein n=1 Tax=unclassified Streptomyces TaxID=2593676 RepID=UPI002E11202C|nr:hypothetical protein OG384_32900 [Streptomyces sp. NBC_01324]
MATEAGGYGQVHRRFEGLFPRQHRHSGSGEELGRAGRERRGLRAGGEELDPQIAVEERQYVQEPGG